MIKIDIISGFLGAGKTTFIQKILKTCAAINEKVVLIENEFGEIGIDGDLVRNEGFTVYEISQGCICCSMKSDFLYTLSEIIEKIKPDRIIFEPSGIFIPDEIIDILKIPQLSEKCFLNSLVTVVDCVNFLEQNSKFGYFFESQISHASVILLSKTKYVPPLEIDKVADKLKKINTWAEIIAKDWDLFDAKEIRLILDGEVGADIYELLDSHHEDSTGCHEQHDHSSHSHMDEFQSFGINTSEQFTHEALNNALLKLNGPDCGEILRGKGLLKSREGFLRFSYVNGQFTIDNAGFETTGRICFIGRNLNKSMLCDAFNIKYNG